MDLSETILQAVRNAGMGDEIYVDTKRIEEVERIFGDTLERQTIVDILKKHDSNVDSALSELFAANEASQKRRAAQQRLERLQSRVRVLTEAFAGVPVDVVTRVVEENDGDLEAASAFLLDKMQQDLEKQERALSAKRDEEVNSKKEELLAQRRALVDHCDATFDVLSRSEIAETLTKHNWDLTKAVSALKAASDERKVGNLLAVLPQLKEAQVRAALQQHQWDCAQAVLALTNSAAAPGPASPKKQEDAAAIAAAVEQSKRESQEILESFIRGKVHPGRAPQAAKLPEGAPKPDRAPAPVQPKAPEVKESAAPASTLNVKFILNGGDVIGYSGEIRANVAVAGGEASAYDYVTLVREGETDEKNYLAWDWFKGTELVFTSPGYGRFELRYLRKTAGGQTVALACSQPITVGPSISLAITQDGDVWTVNPKHDASSEALSSSAWVGLFDGERLLEYKYIVSGVPVSFKKPLTNGTYHFRAYVSRWNGPNATSEKLVVAGDDVITMRDTGDGKVHISVVCKSADPQLESVWVWVGHSHETRPSYYRRFRYLKHAEESFTFKKPIHTGSYEARVYKGKDEVLCKSTTIINVE